MKLRSLELRLFRQHIDSTIAFPDGLVGIIGSNGSGKTTIVEAIGFALFGSRALRGKVEDVRTRAVPVKSGRGKKEQELTVGLALEHEGTVFKIERTLSDAKLFIGGEPQAVAVGNRDVSARVASIVGMNYEEFLSTYCTEQKGLEFLSGKKGATEREKFIVRMMGYDRLEEVQEAIRADRKEKRAVLTGYEASLGTREEIERRLETERADLVTAREKLAEASQVLQKSEGEFSTIRERMVKLEDLRSRASKERESVQSSRVRVEERRRRISDIETAVGNAREELARFLKALSAVGSLEEALSSVRRQIATERETLTSKQGEARACELEWRESVSKARAELEVAKTQFSQLERRGEKLGELSGGADCPTCGQALGESFEQVRKHFVAEQRELAKRVRELGRCAKEREEKPERLIALADEVSGVETRIRALEAKLHELNLCGQLQVKIDGLAKEREVVSGEFSLAQENMERAEQRLTDLHFSDEEYLREKGGFDAAQRLVEVARLQRVRLEGEVNTKAAMVERSESELVKFGERAVEVERLRREVRVCDECDRIVTEFRKFVNSSIRPRMAELASEYLADLTDGRYSSVELEDDFTPTVVEDGEAKRVISGGEEDILNLCMRISLSHMLAERAGQHFSLLILDEVFGSLDEGRRGNVLALLEKLRNRFEQIVIITHLEDVKDGVQHLIQVDYDEVSGSATIRAESGLEEEEILVAMNV
jgi:DNA repair protein SbcC/Rad50